MMDREAIYGALFARLPGLTTDLVPGPFVTKRRGLKHWNDVPAPQQPALYQTQVKETAEPFGSGAAIRWTLRLELYVYAYNGDQESGAAGAALNPLLDAIETALAPDPGLQVQTLGQRVSSCVIRGTIETDEGALGPQSIAIIPLELVVDGEEAR
jgi:hypothetical protein